MAVKPWSEEVFVERVKAFTLEEQQLAIANLPIAMMLARIESELLQKQEIQQSLKALSNA